MKLPQRFPGFGLKTRCAFVLLAVVVLLIGLFDWNWFRAPLERYLSERSQRTVRIGDLRVSFGASLAPTLHFRSVYVQNAPWADPRPMAVVGEASFTFSWRSLIDRQPIVTRLVLRDADVDMERQADGLRNWRLTLPDDRGPPRVRVLALEAYRSQIRFIHRGLDLAFQATVAPAPPETPETRAGFSSLIDFSGIYRGAAFEGQALTGPLITFQQTGTPFTLRAHASSGKTRLDVNGSVADLLQLAEIDADVRASGPSLAQLHPFLRSVLPASRPYRIETHWKKSGAVSDLTRVHLALGDSDLAGELHYRDSDDRPTVSAVLTANLIALADLQAVASSTAAPAKTESPSRPGRLAHVDGQLDLRVKQLRLPDGMPELQGVALTAKLASGVLTVAPFELGLAGGRLGGRVVLDSLHQPPALHTELHLRGARFERLWPGLPDKAHVEGLLNGEARLSGQGDSVAAWLGHVSGSLSATMDGGSIANRLDAKLGLNGGKLLHTLVSGLAQIPIRCGAVQIDLQDGRGQTRSLVLDTEQTHVDGSGLLNLREESFELLLVPRPKERSVLTLPSAIRVHGSLQDAEVELAPRPGDMPVSSCRSAALGFHLMTKGGIEALTAQA